MSFVELMAMYMLSNMKSFKPVGVDSMSFSIEEKLHKICVNDQCIEYVVPQPISVPDEKIKKVG